jgi:hypothetical protein
MKAFILVLVGAAFATSVAVAEEAPENRVPKTFDGSAEAYREGGRELGEGFRGVGRGIKKTFKGEAAKEDYKEAARSVKVSRTSV